VPALNTKQENTIAVNLIAKKLENYVQTVSAKLDGWLALHSCM
jgi:hypothetical protein